MIITMIFISLICHCRHSLWYPQTTFTAQCSAERSYATVSHLSLPLVHLVVIFLEDNYTEISRRSSLQVASQKLFQYFVSVLVRNVRTFEIEINLK